MSESDSSAPASAFGGTFVEVLVLIVVVFAAYSLLKEGLFNSSSETGKANFNALADEMNRLALIAVKQDKALLTSQFPMSLDPDESIIVGFSKSADEVREACGNNPEAIQKPAECGGGTCLCYYSESGDNEDFHDSAKLEKCVQINAENIFSLPYRSLGKNIDNYRDTGDVYIGEYSLEDDYTKNFAGDGYPTKGIDYFEAKQKIYAYCKSFGYSTHDSCKKFFVDAGISEKDFDNGALPDLTQETPGQAGKGSFMMSENRGAYTELLNYEQHHLKSDDYSSFVIYGQCDDDTSDHLWKIKNLYIELYKDAGDKKNNIFVGIESIYTKNRHDVLAFANGAEKIEENADNSKYEKIELKNDGEFTVVSLKKNDIFMINNYDGKGNFLKGKIKEIDTARNIILIDLGIKGFKLSPSVQGSTLVDELEPVTTNTIIEIAYIIKDGNTINIAARNKIGKEADKENKGKGNLPKKLENPNVQPLLPS